MKALGLLIRIGFHSVLLVALPFLIGLLAALFAEVSEVAETADELMGWASFLIVPVLLVQLFVIGAKVRRERRALAERGALTPIALLEAVDRHVRIITPRGHFLLGSATVAVILALAVHWAEFGVAAVVMLAIVYIVATVGLIVSGVVVTGFSARASRRGGRIEREMAPAVVLRGDSVEERFHLERVPVPPGFHLVIHDPLPARLETESRYVADPKVGGKSVTLAGPVRRTPRGIYEAGPAHIWYQDILGLTRIAVVRAASARLTVLPRMCPVTVGEPPRTRTKADDPLTILHRFPTEDLFRFREYMPRDDTRRIQWKLSVKMGRLQVRIPEAVPIARRDVRLLLDTYLAPAHASGRGALEDVLDVLAEAWVSLARALVDRGERVTLVAAVPGPGGAQIVELPCRRGEQPRWSELAARVAWQGALDLDRLVQAAPGPAVRGAPPAMPVVVTARLAPLPALPGSGFTWAWLDPALAASVLPKVPVDRSAAAKLFTYRYPIGAEENSIMASLGRSQLRAKVSVSAGWAERGVRMAALQVGPQLRARGEPVYKITRHGAAYRVDPS